MKRLSQIVFLLAIFLIASILLFNNKPNKEIKLKVAEVAHSIFYAPQYVSLHNGYFKEDYLRIEKETIRKQKEEQRLARKRRAEEKANSPKPKAKNRGRAIGQYNDEMVLIGKYESVASASKYVGISEKSIRDAASGKQKHAAGFVWKYLDTTIVD